MFSSVGTLKYFENPYNAIITVDPGIYFYYRALIPPALRPNGQRHKPHISVVRKQTPTNLNVWGKYEGRLVGFFYENIVRFGDVYCWLNVYSSELDEILDELGLPYYNGIQGSRTYHITLGNTKDES